MENIIAKLNFELENCINDNKAVKIHLLINDVAIRDTVIPNEVDVNENGIYLTSDKWFQIEIDKKIENAEYDEYENSYCLKTNDSEIYFDF